MLLGEVPLEWVEKRMMGVATAGGDYADICSSEWISRVISPDNRSRAEINGCIHAELQQRGLVSNEEHRIRTLVPRQDLTGADRTWAERYEVADVLRYSRASKETGSGKASTHR